MILKQYNLIIPGIPRSKKARSSKLYERKIYNIAKRKISYPLTTQRLYLSIHYFHNGKTRADLDNITKTIFDGLKGAAYKDDAQVNHCEIQACDITKDYWIKNIRGEWMLNQLKYNEPFVAIVIRRQ